MTAFNSVDDLYRSMIDQCSSLQDKNFEMETSILDTLFRDEKYDLVLYALEKGFTLSPKKVKQIKLSGDLKLYQYCFSHQLIKINLKLMNLAVKIGNLETVKWLRENGCPWGGSICAYAADNGHLEILKWARENGCLWHLDTCAYAAMNGHLEVLKWARENGCPWDYHVCTYAASRGHLEVLKWSLENGCPWTKMICRFAAGHGHLEVLQWVSSEYRASLGDEEICLSAVRGKQLETLKWLRKNGCPWNKEQCLGHASNSSIREWIKSN